MSRSRRALALSLVALMATLACEEITTRARTGELVVTLSVESPFVDVGDFLVGDTVRLVASVTENGRPVPTSGQRFTSDTPEVVEILGVDSAVFTGTGTALIRVTFEEPRLVSGGRLSAELNVRVTRYMVELALSSTITGEAVAATDALVNDTVAVSAAVRQDGEEVPSSGVRIRSSSNTAVIDPDAVSEPDRAVLVGDGTAVLTVTVDQPPAPGGPVTGTIEVTVKDFAVNIAAVSRVVGSTHLAAGDTLVTDSVQFSATVVKAANDTVPTTGAIWASSDEGVVEIVDAAAGLARFLSTGTATVSVDFADPELPGAPFGKDIRVTTFETQVNLESLVTGPGALEDTLVTDSVAASVAVARESDGQPRTSVLETLESSDSSVARPKDSDELVFPDTGAVQLFVTLAEPRLPQRVLKDTLDLRVTTYTVRIDSVSNAAPVMGDTIRYFATATETRNDTELSNATLEFASSDPPVVRFLNVATGRALARDTGSAQANVTLVDPGLPRGTVDDAFTPTSITEERFYGVPDTTRGDFGDTVVVARSEVHFFTDSTRVVFPNGTVGFVDSVTADTLRFVVGAGTDAGQLRVLNLEDDTGAPRDSVLTRFSFEGMGTVDDPFEPNDGFPLDPSKDQIDIDALPFEAFLSIDPGRTPSDSNFFYIRVPSGSPITVDVRAAWQQEGNIDFFICNATGGTSDDPPEGYDEGACSRPKDDNSSGAGDEVEEALDVILGVGRHVFGFYCPAAGPCPAIPLTYKVTIAES